MSKLFIEQSTLTSIADAIRSKAGTTDLIATSSMAQAIIDIPSGGDGVSVIDYQKYSSRLVSGYSSIVSVINELNNADYILDYGYYRTRIYSLASAITYVKEFNYTFPNLKYVGNYGLYTYPTETLGNVFTTSNGDVYDRVLTFPQLKYVGDRGFLQQSHISKIVAPVLTTISSYGFASVNTLQEIECEKITDLGASAFAYCGNLKSIYLPNLKILQNPYIFTTCNKMSVVNIPSVSEIGASNVFYGCEKLEEIIAPNLERITAGSIFNRCFKLSMLSFPKLSLLSGGNMFNSCSSLNTIYLMSNSVCKLSTSSVFSGSPYVSAGATDRYIYVPMSLVDGYLASTNWAIFKSRIVGVE